MVVEETPIRSNHRFRRNRPRKADPRRKVRFVRKLVIVVPTQAQVRRKVLEDPPVILNECAVVIVAKPDAVVVRCQASLRIQKIDSGIDGTKRSQVINRRKQLVEKIVRLSAIDVRSLIVPPKLP